MRFKQWLVNELKLGSSGMDTTPAMTSQATTQVAQNWLSNDKNPEVQKLPNIHNRSVLGKALMSAGSNAIKISKPVVGAQTTAPQVAQFIGNSLGLPPVIKSPKPSQIQL